MPYSMNCTEPRRPGPGPGPALDGTAGHPPALPAGPPESAAVPPTPAAAVLSGSALVIVGPTACAKSALALAVARLAGDVELLSADSMQVYRGMDIGTAKPSVAEQAEVTHHLIDLVGAHEPFSVSQYQQAAARAGQQVHRRGHRVVLVGGTGLYVQSVVDELAIPGQYPAVRLELEAEADTAGLHRRLAELDPVAAGRMEASNRRRIVRALEVTVGSGQPFSSFGPGLAQHRPSRHRIVGLSLERDQLDERIAARYQAQLDAGFLAEVRELANAPEALSASAAQALGYRELLAHLHGACRLEEAVAQAVTRTRQFARRQQRWFRRDPRIRWLDAGLVLANPMAVAATLLEEWSPR